MAPLTVCDLCRHRHKGHTVRGWISGALKKKLGLPIAAEKVEGRGMVYRLPEGS